MPRLVHVRSTALSAAGLVGFMLLVGDLGADSIGVPTPTHVFAHLAWQWYFGK